MQAAPMDDAPPLGGDAPADVFIADDSLAEDIAALSIRVDKLAETIGGIAEQTATVRDATDDLSARVPDVEEAVRILSGALTELSEGVVALSNRVAALEAAGPLAGAAGKLSYAIGLRELDRAVSGSGPYATELSAISPFVEEDDPGFAVLEKYAAQGVYSVATLRTAFAAVAGAAVRADGTDPEGDWADRMWDSLRALVVVRPIGEQAGGGTAAIVARAETRLAAGDLAAAVREVENLEGPAAAAAEAWLGDAHARLEVEQALAGLTLRLTRALAEGEG